VLYTHEHADHVNGIDDLRIFSVRQRRPIPCHGPAETLERVRSGLPLHFRRRGPALRRDLQTPARPAAARTRTEVHDRRESGFCPWRSGTATFGSFGYRFGPLAYITDVKGRGGGLNGSTSLTSRSWS
jgi:phosphoribosyl 1,2-cyclic phosphate phosphodiesterase